MIRFVGRQEEIGKLLDSFNRRKGVLNVVRGRRRIGKSTLIKELPHRREGITLRYLISSPPDDKISDEQERVNYAHQVQTEFQLPYLPPHSTWQALFYFIVDQCIESHTILAIDEVNWLGRKADFPIANTLWEVWERRCAQKADFMMILSGSLASWLEKNILQHEGYVGRITQTITLRELPLHHVREFYADQIQRASPVDLIKLLCAFGAVPLYLEYLDLKYSAEENIAQLAYSPSGPLFDEFDRMFNDLFSEDNHLYRRVIEAVAESSSPPNGKEIAKGIGIGYSGRLNDQLDTLCETGFLRKEKTWDIKKQEVGSIQRFRIADNYTAFYFRSIKKHAQRMVERGLQGEPGNLANILGLQFEVLALNNIDFILQQLRVRNPLYIGSYFQTETQRRAKCQVDILIQTNTRLYVCECKLSNSEVGTGVIAEVKKRIERLERDKTLICHPVLIHANGVSKSVLEADYFDHVVDLRDALRA